MIKCSYCNIELIKPYWDSYCKSLLCKSCIELHNQTCDNKKCVGIWCHYDCENCGICVGNIDNAEELMCHEKTCKINYLCDKCSYKHYQQEHQDDL